jgi:chemotaxis protein methyltransferase WspC
MSIDAIKKLLHQKIGLNAVSIGSSSIERAIEHRRCQSQLKNVEDYYGLLLSDMQELTELVEEIVVPETWFFRNKTPFEAFQEFYISQVLSRESDEQARILSIPCSTGEEPYSILISLLEIGIDLNSVSVDAVDISKKALATAKQATYGRNSFRDVNEEIRNRYFVKSGANYQLMDEIKSHVTFKQGNFLIGSLAPHIGYYDVIFCRNLLIYFDRQTQSIALEKLHRSLREDGALFVGHAETSQITKILFKQLPYANSFGYQKVTRLVEGKRMKKSG